MIINVIKFTHLIMAMSILGLLASCWLITIKPQLIAHKELPLLYTDCAILVFMLVAGITGSFLIYPKGFSLNTPWIQAAYALLSLCFVLLLLQTYFRKKLLNRTGQALNKIRLFVLINYSVLLLLLIIIVHDAVAKQPLLFGAY